MQNQQIKPFLLGAICGCIGLSALMFGTGWAVQSRTAEMDAGYKARNAVVDSLASICKAQFDISSNKEAKLSAMAEIVAWKRGAYVAEQGWATMPGKESPDGLVANECAVLLVKEPS